LLYLYLYLYQSHPTLWYFVFIIRHTTCFGRKGLSSISNKHYEKCYVYKHENDQPRDLVARVSDY
jgi:hypothetical protein